MEALCIKRRVTEMYSGHAGDHPWWYHELSFGEEFQVKLHRLFLSVLACACLLHAQEYRSTLSGRVTDPSGSAVPNVNVVATKMDTNTHFPTVTGPEGLYTVPQLPPGSYELTADAPGFKKFVQSGIELASNARVAVDIQLTIGKATESVTVTEDAPPLTTLSASAGQSITTGRWRTCPSTGALPWTWRRWPTVSSTPA